MQHPAPGRTVMLALVGLLIALLTACAAQEEPLDDAVAIVVGAHANAPAVELPGDVPAVIDRVVRSQGTAALVANSGRPTITTQGRLTRTCNNQPACDQAIVQTVSRITTTVTSTRAQSPENNLLAALDLAGLAIRDRAGAKTIVVVDSGLQTVGSLRFQDPGVLDAQPTEIADFLANTSALPDLSGLDVVLAGIGDTWAPQQQLTLAERANLKAIWEAIVRRAGANDVRVVSTPLAAAPPVAGLPPVTPVTVQQSISFDGSTIELPDSAVPFQPDTAVLRDPAATRAALGSLAEGLRTTRRVVHLTGTTANVGPLDGQRTLGLQRAETIKTVLIELGVPDRQMTTTGVGSQWPGYVADHDPAGVLLPGPAALNRNVLIEPVRAES